jgi:hypothetical protein
MRRWIFCVCVFAVAAWWAAVLQAGPDQQGVSSDQVVVPEGNTSTGTVTQTVTPRKCPEGQVWSLRQDKCVPVAGPGLPQATPQPSGGGGSGGVSKGTEEEHQGDGIVGDVGE